MLTVYLLFEYTNPLGSTFTNMDISSQRVRIHIPIPILGDSDEIQHQECLKQLEIARRLCSIRNDSPEAERLYREYMKIHQHWLDEQQAIEEQEQGKNLHSYDERWSAVGQGYPLSSKVKMLLSIFSVPSSIFLNHVL